MAALVVGASRIDQGVQLTRGTDHEHESDLLLASVCELSGWYTGIMQRVGHRRLFSFLVPPIALTLGCYEDRIGISTAPAPAPPSTAPTPDDRLRADASIDEGARADRRDALTAGLSHTCLLRAGGSVACWGSDESGQLGRGTDEDASATPSNVPGLIDIRSISAGDAHVCALTAIGDVVCWGENSYGQLGDGTTDSRNRPTPIADLHDVVELRAGIASTCARTAAAGIFCWGSNGAGQLGTGDHGDHSTPTSIAVPDAGPIALGLSHMCMIQADRTVACWGDNDSGQLGDGTLVSRPTPAPVTGLDEVVQLTSKLNHTCALRADGSAWCWGDGSHGQLGSGDTRSATTPTLVAFRGTFRSLRAGYLFTCGIDATDHAQCWGEDHQPVPTPVSELAPLGRLDDLAAGGHFGCALHGAQVACWGGNGYGQGGSHTLP